MQYTVVLAPDFSCHTGVCFRRSGDLSVSSTVFVGLLLLATLCFHTCGQIMCTTRFYGSFSATSRSIPFFVVQHPVRKLGGRGASRGEPKTRFWGDVYRPLLFHPLLPEVDRMQRCGALVALLRSAPRFFSFMARKCHNSEDGDNGTCDGS